MDISSDPASSGSNRQPIHDGSTALGYLEKRCPVRAAIDVIGGRWKPSILELIHKGPRRHGELKNAIDGISSQALSLQLRQLTADGVVEKAGSVSPTYHLTTRGEQLANVMEELAIWGSDYLQWRAHNPA